MHPGGLPACLLRPLGFLLAPWGLWVIRTLQTISLQPILPWSEFLRITGLGPFPSSNNISVVSNSPVI